MKVTIKNHEVQEMDLPEISTAKDLAESLNLRAPDQALAVSVNGITKDLNSPLQNGDEVTFWDFTTPEGKEVFWHTSAHLLAQAVLRLFPDAIPTIGPPIENGFYYDFANLQISDTDLPKIEKEMKNIVKENFQSQRQIFTNKEEALSHFPSNPYKRELIEGFDEDQKLTAYRQGEFFDLCRGPHLFSLGKIKALKVTKVSGAYWRGDAKNEMLTRIYGITFPEKQQLQKHLHLLEEAKKRDHKILGPKLGLFALKEEAPGMPFILPKGMFIWLQLIGLLRSRLEQANYEEIKTPIMLTKELWERSGHWEHYRDNMYTSIIDEREFAIKPMNCPGCMLYYKSGTHSYRDLPLRIAEIGQVHRYEASGAISGLLRVRCFHQDDAHVFMKPTDIESEILAIIQFADELYSTFGLDYHLELSTRPEKGTIGSDEEWEHATNSLKKALDSSGRAYKINEGDGAFYGPKIDFHINDALNRTWQCGTIQLDMSLPERFDLEYTDSDGSRKRPVMIHRAIFGSIERFFGILIEHFGGRFPLWISPRQVRILTVADRHIPYAKELQSAIRGAGFQCELDESRESVSKKVRTAQIEQCNYIVTIGDEEKDHQSLNLRTRDNVRHGELQLEPFLNALKGEKETRALTSPFSKGDES